MSKKISILKGYSLLELLIVLAIFIVLASFGAGAFLGFRETSLARETAETIKQDIQLAQHKAMMGEREVGETWVYGIGLDFSNINTDGTYTMFKWCSPFDSYEDGGEITRSRVLASDPLSPIGTPEGEVINGYLPISNWVGSCASDSLVEIYKGTLGNLLDADQMSILLSAGAKYVVFESLTGRTFLYNAYGMPVNYSGNGDYNGSPTLDLLITRDRSSKFDLVTVYPLSGVIIHHVYNNDDKIDNAPSGADIIVNSIRYDRYGIFDEINSYREITRAATATKE